MIFGINAEARENGFSLIYYLKYGAALFRVSLFKGSDALCKIVDLALCLNAGGAVRNDILLFRLFILNSKLEYVILRPSASLARSDSDRNSDQGDDKAANGAARGYWHGQPRQKLQKVASHRTDTERGAENCKNNSDCKACADRRAELFVFIGNRLGSARALDVLSSRGEIGVAKLLRAKSRKLARALCRIGFCRCKSARERIKLCNVGAVGQSALKAVFGKKCVFLLGQRCDLRLARVEHIKALQRLYRFKCAESVLCRGQLCAQLGAKLSCTLDGRSERQHIF